MVSCIPPLSIGFTTQDPSQKMARNGRAMAAMAGWPPALAFHHATWGRPGVFWCQES